MFSRLSDSIHWRRTSKNFPIIFPIHPPIYQFRDISIHIRFTPYSLHHIAARPHCDRSTILKSYVRDLSQKSLSSWKKGMNIDFVEDTYTVRLVYKDLA